MISAATDLPAARKRSIPWGVVAGLSGVFALYLLGALLFARLESVWSPDCGARLIQIHSILEHPPAWWVSYPAAALDPNHHNSPLYFFEYLHGGHTYIFYSFVSALISAALYHVLGYFGLSVLPLLGGFGIVAATYSAARLLRQRYPLAPALLTALATPVALYSIVFWDQVVLAAVGFAAVVLALYAVRNRRLSLWFAAGAVLGAGVWLHEILLPFVPALIAGAWHARRQRNFWRASGAILTGFLLFVIPLAIVNQLVYGSPAGPHLSNNHLGSPGAIIQFLLDPAQWGAGALYTLLGWGDANPAFTWQLKEWLAQPNPQLQAEITTSVTLAIPVLLFALLGLTRIWRRFWGITLLAILGLLGGAVYVVAHDEWAHSLFFACPILLFALAARSSSSAAAPAKDTDNTSDTALLRQTLAVILTVFTLVNLIKPTLGGTEWGSRHLLAVVPGLILLGWQVVESLLAEKKTRRDNGGVRLALLTGFGVLTVASVALQAHAIYLVYGMHARNRELADAIAATADDVIVTEVWWAPLNGASAYNGKKILYAGDFEHDPRPLFARMQQAGIRTYTLIGVSEYSLSDFSRPYGYVPLANMVKPMPMRLVSNRFLLIDGAADAKSSR